MTDAEKLSLAYKLQAADAVAYPDVATALVKVNADALAMLPPAPLPGDVVGVSHVVMPDGSAVTTRTMGDGSKVVL